MSLKQKTVDGLLWSFIDTALGQGIQFFVSIVLARLLLPREFGLMGMILIFIALSEAFVNSGFSSALIRKKDCTQSDYSTVFHFNLIAGIVFFVTLFFAAPYISNFFGEPQLKPIVQVLGIVLIIDSVTLIQRTILTREIDFKLQARVSFIASAVSGLIAIYMAWKGMGVWSLVVQRISRQAINTAFLLFWTKWRPSFIFSIKSFRELFGFGSKLLISSLIDTFYNNIYYLLIGKYFSAQQLGFYTRADEFNRLPSHNLSGIIQRVSYPVLCSIQEDTSKLTHTYRRFIRSAMYISFILMMLMAASAEPLIITLIGEKWRESVPYFRLLCFTGMFYPLHVLNLNIIQVKGRSDLFLKLEIIKKILAVPTIALGIFLGIKVMIYGMMVNALIDFYLNNYWSKSMIGYSIKQQLKDILPSFAMAGIISIAVYSLSVFLPYGYGTILLIQAFSGIGLAIGISEITRFGDYIFLKETIKERIGLRRKPVTIGNLEVSVIAADNP